MSHHGEPALRAGHSPVGGRSPVTGTQTPRARGVLSSKTHRRQADRLSIASDNYPDDLRGANAYSRTDEF